MFAYWKWQLLFRKIKNAMGFVIIYLKNKLILSEVWRIKDDVIQINKWLGHENPL